MEVYAQTTTLIILGLPENASVTLDHLAFTSTRNFRGIKYISPGIHLLTYGFDTSELGMRNGFFFVGRVGDVLAWRWDMNAEQLERIHEQLQEKELQERLQSIHPFLTPVSPDNPEESNTTWSDLTSYITPDLLNRVLPPDWSLTSQTASTNDDAAELSDLPSSKAEAILNFTPINLKRTFDPHAVGRERTEQMLDKSWYLNSLIQQIPDELALLGELQLSFLTVLYMNNFSGFETWKKLFTLFCGCKSALTARQQLFRNFLIVLRQQFDMCTDETFNEIVLEGNFVNENLKTFSSVLEDLEPRSTALEFSFAQLTSLLASKFNWQADLTPIPKRVPETGRTGYDETAWDEEDGDYAPVVVDLEEDDDEIMDADVDFAERSNAAGHMDMSTGKMIFSK